MTDDNPTQTVCCCHNLYLILNAKLENTFISICSVVWRWEMSENRYGDMEN